MSEGVADAAAAAESVQLRCPAGYDQLSVIRAVAANIAVREDFDIDAIADIKMAVDEACAALIERAAPDSTLLCHFRVLDGRMFVRVRATSERPDPLDREGLGWRVLTALVDTATTWVSPAAGTETYLLYVDLNKAPRSTAEGVSSIQPADT